MPVYQVDLLSSGHRFFASPKQSLLNAGLVSGLNLVYGCDGGSCGKCLARLQSGRIQQFRHSDFILSSQQNTDGYFLSCCHSAASDCNIEMPEIGSVKDITEQQIETRVFKRQQLSDQVLAVTLKTPRSQTLNFLAGQHVRIQLTDLLSRNKSPASCPCDGLKLEIHVQQRDRDPFSEYVFNRLQKNDRVNIRGPAGAFVLNDDSDKNLVFIAFDTGFSSIKSLLEHAIALDKEQPIRLYWIVTPQNHPYMENYCRSLEDALDNIDYFPIAVREDSEHCITEVLKKILSQEQPLNQNDLYITLPNNYAEIAASLFVSSGMDSEQWRIDALVRL